MLHYYGFVEEPNAEFCWLFIEDVSDDEKYNPHDDPHRVAAAQWLGIMNKSASGIAAATRLPERGSCHYLTLLQSARDTILANVMNPSLNSDDHALLETILAHCEHLSGNWSQLVSICEGMPQTLVHGDFIKKNIRVRDGQGGIGILPFDWEKAGWGTPAEDISKIDIPTYWSTIQGYWRSLTVQALARLAMVGKVFRCLVFLDWLAPRLAHRPAEQTMNEMQRCESWLADLIRAAEWQD
jgi:hypothetical protein